jgi:adenine-specific DNA-methyltransferase
VSEQEVRSGVKGIVLVHPLEESSLEARKVLERGPWPRFFFTKGGLGGIARKTYLNDVGGRLPTNFWPFSEVGHTDEAAKQLKSLFDGSIPFDTPKPVRLIRRMLDIATDKDSLVLDFFSGSATTAEAVMRANADDGGSRRFILVQIPEKASGQYENLCEIGKERIRRAGEAIAAEVRGGGVLLWAA